MSARTRHSTVSERQYAALSRFRSTLARFLRFSERAARAAGVTPTQYLLLLHLRGAARQGGVTVGELAERLQASAHGTTALIGRCCRAGLVFKKRSGDDRRCVEVHLTARGARLVERVASRHRDELKSLRDVFRVVEIS